MDIRQLSYFIQVADCGSYSLASRKLFISQPALSKTIQGMEKELGFEFFYTYKRRQHLTDGGQVLYDKAVKLVKDYESLMETAYSKAGVLKGKLEIALETPVVSCLVNRILNVFLSDYPLIELSFHEKDIMSIKDELESGNLDAALVDSRCLRKTDAELFNIKKLADFESVAVVSESSSLADYPSISPEDIAGKNFIQYINPDGSEGTDFLMIIKGHSAPKVVMSSSQWQLIFDMVESDYGITIAPYYIYKNLKRSGIKAIPIDDKAAVTSVALISRKDPNESGILTSFLETASKGKLYNDLKGKLCLR